MPKIKAASVPEHRKAQRAALLAAAREMVIEGGFNALKFGELADRADLARPSVYEYFKTKSELAIALIQEEVPEWTAAVSHAVRRASGPEDSVRAFVIAMLELVKSGKHELPFALAASELDDEVQRAVAQAHEQLFALVAPALAALGVRDMGTCAELLGGVVTAAAHALRHGHNRRSIIDAAARFALAGSLALRG